MLPDIQSTKTDYKKKIEKVGIRNIYTKIKFADQITSAKCSAYVSLIANKGIHMSRLAEVLQGNIWNLNNIAELEMLLDDLEKRNKEFSEDWYVKFSFDYLLQHKSPISDKLGYIKYPIKINATKNKKQEYNYTIEVFIPYISLCPCSKEISEANAHNQKSEAWITVELDSSNILDTVNLLIQAVRTNASSNIYSILKREDEKYVTEEMYKNPMFVEDMVRAIEKQIEILLTSNISDYSIVVEHFESIHQHTALAITNAKKRLK